MQQNAERGAGGVRLRWRLLSWSAVWLLIVYLGIVLPFDRFIPAIDRWYGAVALLVLSSFMTYAALKRWFWQGPESDDRTKNALALASATLLSLLAADVGFTAYKNLSTSFRFDPNKLVIGREWDANEWDGELMPKTYTPTSANFWLYKPGQTKSAMAYGEHYYPALLHHKILRESVLEPRRVDFEIDKYGLRNVDDPASAKIFAIGDSFCFGYHTSQDVIFTTRLKSLIGEPVYNMGVSSTSPMQQYLILDYMLRNHPDTFKPQQLLWLIFEGNDLEESYEIEEPVQGPGRLRTALEGTLVGAAVALPTLVRNESVVWSLTNGDLHLASAGSGASKSNHYELDGELLAFPLYHSERHGYRLIRQGYIDHAVQPAEYVRNHPNRPRLDDVFHRMKALAQERGFDVTIVIVPTDVRLYKDYFEDLAAVTKEPHFINYVKQLSEETGFKHIDLNELLAPYAEKEMIYYRDDTHWNERGHEIVANILAERAIRTH